MMREEPGAMETRRSAETSWGASTCAQKPGGRHSASLNAQNTGFLATARGSSTFGQDTVLSALKLASCFEGSVVFMIKSPRTQ